MRQQQNLMWILVLVFVASILIIWTQRSVQRQDDEEGFLPFRHTGACPPRTGYNYLDAYEQEQYYKKFPYIYPTPQTYVTDWFKLHREEDDFMMKQRLDHGMKN